MYGDLEEVWSHYELIGWTCVDKEGEGPCREVWITLNYRETEDTCWENLKILCTQ